MTDQEIETYLKNHSYSVLAADAITDIFNTSMQIIDYNYDFDTHIMTIITPDNTFTFEWVLGVIS